MPKVGSKAYPYTPKGKAQAKEAKAQLKKSKPTVRKK
jgi:hypothetical protein